MFGRKKAWYEIYEEHNTAAQEAADMQDYHTALQHVWKSINAVPQTLSPDIWRLRVAEAACGVISGNENTFKGFAYVAVQVANTELDRTDDIEGTARYVLSIMEFAENHHNGVTQANLPIRQAWSYIAKVFEEKGVYPYLIKYAREREEQWRQKPWS